MNSEDQRIPRRERLEFIALDPTTKQLTSKVRLTPEKLRTFTSAGGRGSILEADNSVRQVLSSPFAIFEELEEATNEPVLRVGPRRDKSDWLYYVGKPSHSYDADGKQSRWSPASILIIEVTDDGVISRWWRETGSPRDNRLPFGYSTRFATQRYQNAA
jgi:hypothetical protein